MIKNSIDELLLKQNKTRYWLAKEIGVGYSNLCDMASNKTRSIKFDILEDICKILNCTPNDVLQIYKNTGRNC